MAAQPRVATMAKLAREMTCRTADLTFWAQPAGRGMSLKPWLHKGKPP